VLGHGAGIADRLTRWPIGGRRAILGREVGRSEFNPNACTASCGEYFNRRLNAPDWAAEF